MLKKSLLVVFAAALSSVAVTAQADKAEGAATARQGVMRCGGNQFLRLNGSEVQFTSWVFRNFDSANDIRFDRMRVFDAAGVPLFDSASSTLPPSESGTVGPGDDVLAANESVIFNSLDFVPLNLAENRRPLQLEVQWSSPRGAVTLDGIVVRVSHGRDPATGAHQGERARHAVECRTVSAR